MLGSPCSPATMAQPATLLQTTAPSISPGIAAVDELYAELDASLCSLLMLLLSVCFSVSS